MARLPRVAPIGISQHVIQRGNNRQVCFCCDEDFIAYAGWLREYAAQYQVQVHAWVFMTNHVHLLLTPLADQAISKMMQALGRMYGINRTPINWAVHPNFCEFCFCLLDYRYFPK